jgi:glycosyltransferase involved in cell wall biosynthesis
MKASVPRSKWLFVDGSPLFGGHEVMLLRWIEQLLENRDVEPRLLARQGGRLQKIAPAQALTPDAFAAQDNREQPAPRGGVWQDWKLLRSAIAREKPEFVVFASGSLGDQMLLITLARLSGAKVLVYVPLLGTFESMGYHRAGLKDKFVRWIYGKVPQAWVAITAEQAEQFRRWARPSGHVFVLPNTVAPAIESAPRLALRRLNAMEPLRVLVLGRLDDKQKGLDFLLNYLESAPVDVQRRLRVCVTGEGPYRATLEARRQANSALASCLVLGEWMPAEQALADNDVLMMPSRFEGVPLVMLEAMALGLPVIGSDLPGVRAHLPETCLFPVGDMDGAVRIIDWLHDLDVRNQLADWGLARYEATASSRAFAQSVSSLVHQVRHAFSLSGPVVNEAGTPLFSKEK